MFGKENSIPLKSSKIQRAVSVKKLAKDMKLYRDEAMKLGATDAVVLKTGKLPIDERAVLKCQVPRCHWYGACANCPPYSLSVLELQRIVKMYQLALFFKIDVDSQIIVRQASREYILTYKKVCDIVNAMESKAFYDGYYFAIGFAAGSCHRYLCGEHKTCMALKPGQICRFPYRARPSMEAVGFDVFKLCTAVGWDVYPIGHGCSPEAIPHGTLMGLVLIK